MSERKEIRKWISDYNRYKAELLAIRTPQNRKQIDRHLAYYDHYLRIAEKRIVELDKRRQKKLKLGVQYFIAFMIVLFFSGVFIFLKPNFMGMTAYTSELSIHNSTSYFLQIKGEVFTLSFRGNATGNVSVYVEYGNKTYLAFSA
ncbi:MAG: hypothetical protein QXK37_05485, partial [Candidatus Woesearchaeota archaeon]